jgi:branched-chain amino acid transport system permease protein
LALVIVYRSTGLLNVAQGEMATFSTYIGLIVHSPVTPALAGTELAHALLPGSPWPIWASIGAAIVVGAVVSAGAERLVIRRLPDPSGANVVSATVGILLLVNGLTERTWRAVLRAFPPAFPNDARDFISIGEARLRYVTIGTWATLLVVLMALWIVLRFTKIGLAFRAVSSSPQISELLGIRAGRVATVGWALAGGIGALAGCLVAPTVLLEPGMMVRVLIYSLVAATIGGLDSLGGAVLGGMLVGVAQTMIGGYVLVFGSQLSLPGALLVMVLVLMWRPTGLFGTRKVERV